MANELMDTNASGSKDGGRAVRAGATRGVSYPFMSLPEAVDAARKIYNKERKTAAPVASAIQHLGYAESSSGGRQTISALLQFGLLEDEGRKEDRHVQLTVRALDVLLAGEGSEERRSALIDCVKSPKIYGDIFAKWPDELPSDQTISYFLLRDRNFNPKAITSFIRDLRDSLAYVGVEHPRELDGADSQPTEQHSGVPTAPPSNQLLRNLAAHPSSRPTAADLAPVFQQTPVAANETEWMKGSLSKTTGFRILISGEIGAKQITRLVKLLEAQKEVLEDDDDHSDIA